jgi:hypothetical protein
VFEYVGVLLKEQLGRVFDLLQVQHGVLLLFVTRAEEQGSKDEGQAI